MKRKQIFITLFFSMLMLAFNMKVSAFSSSIANILQSGVEQNYNGYDSLALKYYGDTTVFCTQFKKTTPAAKDVVCTLVENWNDEIKAGVGHIISKIGEVPISGNAPENYYYGELAINQFLYDSGVDKENTKIVSDSSPREVADILNTRKSLYDEAIAIRNEIKSNSINIKQTSLTFEKSGENYVSNTIELEKSINDNFKIESTIGSVVNEGNNKYHVVVPVSSVQPGTTVNVKLKASISKSYVIAQNYSCGEYQSITPNYTENKVFSYDDSIEGSITSPSKGTLIINKYDSNNNALSGATVKVTGPNGYSETFVTTGNPIIINDLEYGTYTIEETIAPAGYIKTSKKTVTLSSENLSATVNLINGMTRISIIKYDEDGVTKLQGANLKLVDKDGKTVNSCPDERRKSFLCEWTSTKSEKVIEGLPAGTYYLVEEGAPKGYNLNNNKIEIVISQSGKVTIDGKESDNGLIEFYNSKTRAEISKTSVADGKELAGATLEILDSEEKSISCTIIDNDGKDKKLDKCEWVSGKEKTILKGLEAGTYYLVETIAPEGYELNTDKIKFEIKADGTTAEAEIENNLIVKVPDTLSSRSILLIAISMFDIALGIGILTYVKKNKIQE